jgi:DeoR/GlpR family transcriptional regulator of sugar metabolism
MLRMKRQSELLEILSQHEIMSIADLAGCLNTSMMTVRRDVEFLEEQGLVKKVHGGALLVRQDLSQPPFSERIREYSDEKARIGKAGAGFIKKGDIVLFDAGTTPLAVTEHIPNELEFTAVTTGLMTAIALCSKPRVNVISIGGDIHHTSYSCMSYMSVEMIRRFHADIAFVSTKAVSIPEGAYEAQLPLIEVKQAIVSISKKVVLLADHSKFKSKSLCLSIPFSSINTVITDQATPQECLNRMTQLGIEVLAV